MRRLISLLLILLMLPLFPQAFASDAAQPDAWERIVAIEDSVCNKRGGAPSASAQAFTAVLDKIAEAIVSAPEYLPESLFQNGDALYWQTDEGISCGYLPAFRAKLRNSEAPDEPDDEPAQSYSTRSGSPGAADVSVFQPYYGLDKDFTKQYQNEGLSIASELDGTCHLYTTDDATIDRVAAALESSAVVIFDSHGLTDYENGTDSVSRANTSYLCLQSGEGITQQDMRLAAGAYGNYYHAVYLGVSGKMQFYGVDGTAIANHMRHPAPNNILWSAICLGMATDGICTPLREKGVEVVYGYSESVTFKADYRWEETFWRRMKNGATVAAAAAYMKQFGGHKDPYETKNPAYPIFTSSEDPYPGRDLLTERQTVQSSWLLFPQYKLRVTVNDPSLGSVSVNGAQLTVHPNADAVFSGYELVSGSAEITEDGSVLYFELYEDCTVRVDFAPREKARLILSTPREEEQLVFDKYIGDTVTLPATESLTQGYEQAYEFCGWTSAPVVWSDKPPTELYPAGSDYPLTQSTESLYALYTARPTSGGRGYTTEPRAAQSCAEHSFSQWEQLVSPTCTQDGAERRTCSVCGAFEQRLVPSPGHTLAVTPAQPPTCTQEGTTERIVCSVCGLVLQEATVLSPPGHRWDAGSVLTEAGEREPGLRVFVCTACGAQRTQIISCLASDSCEQGFCYGSAFKDMPPYGSWAHRPIDWAIVNGVTEGVSAEQFLPDEACTRGQIVTFLWRAAGKPAAASSGQGQAENPFIDVSASSYCYQAVLWAVEQGITTGIKKDEFRPNSTCTRAQAVTFLWRFAGCALPSQSRTEFTDVSPIAYYASAVSWALEQNVTNGMEPGKFSPNAPCTRAQVVTFLFRALNC